jgi:AraC-like DNA-binding protein
MSCSPFDLRDYFLRELADPQQRQVEAHVKVCQQCREELDRLRITEAALISLRDEEIPQRIAFVSDKIFEPSSWRRWWAAFWGSTARLGFASAAMLSVALVVFAFRPAPAPRPSVNTVAAVAPVSEAEIQRRIQAAVDQAVPAIEARYAKRADQLVQDVERRDLEERRRIILAADAYGDRMGKEMYAQRQSAYNASAFNIGEGK